MRKEFYCIQSTNIIAKVQLYTDAVRCRSQLLPGRSFPRKKLKSKGRSHFRNKKASF